MSKKTSARAKKIKSKLADKKIRPYIFIVGFAIIGVFLVLATKAATPNASVEIDSGSVVSPAAKFADSTASGGQAVKFGSSTPPSGACLSRSGVTIKKPSQLTNSSYPNGFIDNPDAKDIWQGSISPNTVVDLTNTIWHDNNMPFGGGRDNTKNYYALRISGGDNVCISGGEIINRTLDRDTRITDWEEWHDKYGFHISGVKNLTIENIFMRNFGDQINFSDGSGNVPDGFLIKDSLLQHSHDDCIQNDKFAGGKITNVFFDGCYSGFSARMSSTSWLGTGKLWEIEDSLLWLEPELPVYHNHDESNPKPGHSGFIKWEKDALSDSVSLSLKNVTFMARKNPYDQNLYNGARTKLVTCQNVTIIWASDKPLPPPPSSERDGTQWPAGCVTWVTGAAAGRAAWLAKVNAWYTKNPQFAKYRHSDDVYFKYCPDYDCSVTQPEVY